MTSPAGTAPAGPEAPPFRRDRLAHTWIVVKAFSDAGDAVWTIALAWTAVQVASPATAGAVVAAGTIPRAAVLLVGGAVADRFAPRRVMVLANLMRIGVLISTAAWVAVTAPSVAVLIGAAVLFGLTDALYEPSAATIGRQLVRPEDLAAYSGLSQTATRLGVMGGSALGGVLVAGWGLACSASVDALTFVAVVVFIALWLRPRFSLQRSEPEPVLRGIAHGFGHLREVRSTRVLVFALSGLNLAVGPALALGIPLRVAEQGWGAELVGLLGATVGLGAAIGALTVVRWRPSRAARAGFLLLVGQGVAIPLIGVGATWVAATACFAIGTTAGAASALIGSVFAATVDGAYFGRMASIQRLGDDVLMPGAMVLFGALAGSTSVSIALAVFGVTMGLLMLWPLGNRTLMTIQLSPEQPALRAM